MFFNKNAIGVFSAAILAVALGSPTSAQAQTSGFCLDWPMGERNGAYAPGHSLQVLQNYNNVNPNFGNRRHAAVDLRYDDDPDGTVDASVYASAAGRVVCRANAGYPGGVLVLEHALPDGTRRYTQYGHLNQIFVVVTNEVAKGQEIATVLDQDGNTHLHFEYREWMNDPVRGDCLGRGYASAGRTPDEEGWQDPVAAVLEHQIVLPRNAFTPNTAMNLRAEPSLNGAVVTSIPAGSTVSASGVARDQDGLNHWWYRVSYSGNTGYLAALVWNGWGSEIHPGLASQACPQATRIRSEPSLR